DITVYHKISHFNKRYLEISEYIHKAHRVHIPCPYSPPGTCPPHPSPGTTPLELLYEFAYEFCEGGGTRAHVGQCGTIKLLDNLAGTMAQTLRDGGLHVILCERTQGMELFVNAFPCPSAGTLWTPGRPQSPQPR